MVVSCNLEDQQQAPISVQETFYTDLSSENFDFRKGIFLKEVGLFLLLPAYLSLLQKG